MDTGTELRALACNAIKTEWLGALVMSSESKATGLKLEEQGSFYLHRLISIEFILTQQI